MCSFTFLSSNLFIVFQVKLLTSLGKLSLAKGIATFMSAIIYLNELTKHQKIHLIELFQIFDFY